MRLVDWSGSKLRATDDTGSSDPFLKFYIRGSRQKRYRNWYKRGGLIGRATSTDVQVGFHAAARRFRVVSAPARARRRS